jgi:hypothetical protein
MGRLVHTGLGSSSLVEYVLHTGKLPLWRGAGAGGVLAGTRRPSAAGDGVPPSLQIPPHTHILLARSSAPCSPFRRRAHSPTAFSGPMARPPPSPRVLLPHTCTQDGWFLQPKRRPARLPRRTVPSNCICRCSRMRARLSPPRVLLPHTCTQDGWFLQPKRRPDRLHRRTVPSYCICRCSRMRARLPLHILLLHTQVSR